MAYLVLGAGLMGRALLQDLLVNSSAKGVTVADMDPDKLQGVGQCFEDKGLETVELNVSDTKATTNLLKDHNVLINATSYTLNVRLTKLAIENNCHMLDLGGNMAVVNEQMAMSEKAQEAGVTVLPNCGLAPGMANVVGAWLLAKFEEPASLKIFVGGLPRDPVPPLNYMQLFSIQGLINEYVEPCDMIIDGDLVTKGPLTDLEDVKFPQPYGTMEAFNTSGGISNMIRTYEGKVRTMYYKTLRYPGHCAIFKALLDMGLMADDPLTIDDVDHIPRTILERALASSLPKEGPDVTLMKIMATGIMDGIEQGMSAEMIDHADPISKMSSMMRTTAFPTSIIAQMVMDQEITQRGVFTPDIVVNGPRFMERMAKRGIHISLDHT